MSGRRRHPADPQWDLTLEIAGRLWLYGEHVVEMDPAPTQPLVDLQWAARQAGRLIGVRTQVDISRSAGRSPRLVVSITYRDPDGRGLVRAQDGLDALVRSVREQQAVEQPATGGRITRRTSTQPPSSRS